MLFASGGPSCGFGWGGIVCPQQENGMVQGYGNITWDLCVCYYPCVRVAVCFMCGSVRQVVGAVRGGKRSVVK